MSKPQITTHFMDGRPSETRDMTDEEIAEMKANAPAPIWADNDDQQPQ